MIFRELSNAVFRFSLRRPGAEIMGGGVQTPPPPAGGGKSRGPAGRGLTVASSWMSLTRQGEGTERPQERPRLATTGLSLRNQAAHSLPRHRLTLFRNSYLPSTTRLWNNLPPTITTSLSKQTFRRLLYDHFHIKRPPSFHSSGSRFGNAIHSHLRLNMSILNAHLFSVNHPSVSSPACACGYRSENTKHLILHCPLYTKQRQELFETTLCLVPTLHAMTQEEKIDLFLNCANLNESSSLSLSEKFQKILLSCGRFGNLYPQP